MDFKKLLHKVQDTTALVVFLTMAYIVVALGILAALVVTYIIITNT